MQKYKLFINFLIFKIRFIGIIKSLKLDHYIADYTYEIIQMNCASKIGLELKLKILKV